MRSLSVIVLAGFLVALAVSGALAAPVTHMVTMPSEDFVPYHLEIQPGETVTWRNTGGQGHDVTSFDGLFASPVLANGDSFSFTFSTPGTYGYYCTIHPSTMVATVVVGATPAPPVTPVPTPVPRHSPAPAQPIAPASSPAAATSIPSATSASTPVTPTPTLVVQGSSSPASTPTPGPSPAPTRSAASSSQPAAATLQTNVAQPSVSEDAQGRGSTFFVGVLLLALLPVAAISVLLVRRLR